MATLNKLFTIFWHIIQAVAAVWGEYMRQAIVTFAEAGRSGSEGSCRVIVVRRSECQRQHGSSEVEASDDPRHHHSDGSYLWRGGKGHGQLTVSVAERCSARVLTRTSTVETSRCFPSAAALRPVCPESQDWTVFHI